MHEIENIGERTIFFPFFDDTPDGVFTDAFHCTESETDITFFVYGEFQVTFIYIGAEYFDTHTFAFVHELRDFADVRNVPAQYRCHVLRRIIGFEISRLVSNP